MSTLSDNAIAAYNDTRDVKPMLREICIEVSTIIGGRQLVFDVDTDWFLVIDGYNGSEYIPIAAFLERSYNRTEMAEPILAALLAHSSVSQFPTCSVFFELFLRIALTVCAPDKMPTKSCADCVRTLAYSFVVDQAQLLLRFVEEPDDAIAIMSPLLSGLFCGTRSAIDAYMQRVADAAPEYPTTVGYFRERLYAAF